MILHSTKTSNQTQKEFQIRLDFAEIWTKCKSFNPIYKSKLDKDWLTMQAGAKVVPLLPEHIDIATYGNNGKLIGKRFGQFTNYFMLDIDAGSEYHPLNGSLEDILWALEEIGLCRPLMIRSSTSNGLHIYYPFENSVRSFDLAVAVRNVLTANGITIAGGTCELFPNTKAYQSDYNGHRLPLQAGSFILNDDFEPTTNSLAEFVKQWNAAAKGQSYTDSSTSNNSRRGYVPEWTAVGVSNDIMLAIGYDGFKQGLKTIPELAEWVKKTAINAKGYAQFASVKSKEDIEKGNWPERIAKCIIKKNVSAKSYAASHPEQAYHESASESMKKRLQACIDYACKTIPELLTYGIKNIGSVLTGLSFKLFGQGFSNSTIFKHKEWILSQVESLTVEVEVESESKAEESQVLELINESEYVNDLSDESVESFESDSLDSEEAEKGIHTVNNCERCTRLTHQCFEPGTQPPKSTDQILDNSDSNSESKLSKFLSNSAQLIQSILKPDSKTDSTDSVDLTDSDRSSAYDYVPDVILPNFRSWTDDVVWIDPFGNKYTLEGF
jgi:hypothetical protein